MKRALSHIFKWLSSAGDDFFEDGLDTTGYVRRIEGEFNIDIRDEDAGTLLTLADLCRYVSRQRQEQGHPLADDVIWTSVRRITSDELGVDAAELHAGIRYVEDLNC
jgi:hypothetical protein